MSAESTLIRDENTSTPYFGVVVFSGGYDYVLAGGPVTEGSLPDPEDQIQMYVHTTGIEEDDLTIENYKEIALLGIVGQGVSVDEWSEQKNRSSAKKAVKKIIKDALDNLVSPSTRKYQSLITKISTEARLAGATYDDEESGAEDMDTDFLARQLIENIDPDGPDGWRIKHLISD